MNGPVLPGRNAVLLLEGPIERRIIGKTNLCGHLLQRNSLGDQIFGRDQPPLGHIAVKTKSQPLVAKMGHRTLTDMERTNPYAHPPFGRVLFLCKRTQA